MLFSATMPGDRHAGTQHMRHPMNIRAESAYDARPSRRPPSSSTWRTTSTSPRSSARSCRPKTPARYHLHPHQASGSAARRRPEERGFAAAPCTATWPRWLARRPEEVPRRQDRGARGHRRGRSRHGRPERHARHQLHLPRGREDYVHRIGRTGRAGDTGIAITFVDWADVTRWKIDQQDPRAGTTRRCRRG